MNIQSAELALESKTQLCAVNVAGCLYKEIILPALSNASSLNRGNGYFDLPKHCMQVGFHIDPKLHRDAMDWCWGVFDLLSFGPLISTQKSRTIRISNLGSISESIATIRRMLLVQSPSNERFVYNIEQSFLMQLFESNNVLSAQEYKSLSVEEQLSAAATVYRNILSIVVAVHPRTIETQINQFGSDINLVVWGGFNKKRKKS